MTVDTMSTLFAVLGLLCWVGVLAVGVALVVRRSSPASTVAGLLSDVSGAALWLAWLVGAVCTLGSLYYSQVAHFDPCELCWFQRICMYPLAAILLVAAIRRDRGIWRYVSIQVAVGTAIAIYHTQLQAFPSQGSFCPTLTPCTTRYVWKFGFVSLPFLALSGFVFIATMLYLAAQAERRVDAETAAASA